MEQGTVFMYYYQNFSKQKQQISFKQNQQNITLQQVQALRMQLIENQGFGPKHTFKACGKQFFASNPFYMDNKNKRIGFILYVENNGMYTPRVVYMSQSQGVFRNLPTFYSLRHYDKSNFGEDSLTYPREIQENLFGILNQKITQTNYEDSQVYNVMRLDFQDTNEVTNKINQIRLVKSVKIQLNKIGIDQNIENIYLYSHNNGSAYDSSPNFSLAANLINNILTNTPTIEQTLKTHITQISNEKEKLKYKSWIQYFNQLKQQAENIKQEFIIKPKINENQNDTNGEISLSEGHNR